MGTDSADRNLEACSQPLHNIEKLNPNDVLCGRGVSTNQWEGNCQFRSLVSCNKELYVTSTKRQKMAISKSIVDAVRSMDPPGRFLEKDPDNGLWSDIGERKAIEKTSQALRDGAAQLRKQLSADLHDPDFLNAVFDMDSTENSASEKKKETKTEKKDKKPVKPKVVKKGHRRAKSNPDSLVGNLKKVRPKRMVRAFEGPCSPRPTQVMSQPASPMLYRTTGSPYPEGSFGYPPSTMFSCTGDDRLKERMGEGSLFRNHSFDAAQSPGNRPWGPPMSPRGHFHTRFGPRGSPLHPPVSPVHPGYAHMVSSFSPRPYWYRPPLSPSHSWSAPRDTHGFLLQSPCSPASTSVLMSRSSPISRFSPPSILEREDLAVPELLQSRVSSPPAQSLYVRSPPTSPRDFTPPMSPKSMEAKSREEPKTLTPTHVKSEANVENDRSDAIDQEMDVSDGACTDMKDTDLDDANADFDAVEVDLEGIDVHDVDLKDKSIIDTGNDGIEIILHEKSSCESPALEDNKVLSADDTSSTALFSDGSITPLPFDCTDDGYGDPAFAMEISEDLMQLPIAPVGPQDEIIRRPHKKS